MLVATLANADTWEEFAGFARWNEEYLRQYTELKNGIPSHDTIQRAMGMIRPENLQQHPAALFHVMGFYGSKDHLFHNPRVIKEAAQDAKLIPTENLSIYFNDSRTFIILIFKVHGDFGAVQDMDAWLEAQPVEQKILHIVQPAVQHLNKNACHPGGKMVLFYG